MACPYRGLPPSSYWDSAVSGRTAAEIDPHLESLFAIDLDTRVASAGSCFAQHISRALIERGFNYTVAELPPHGLSKEVAARYGYGIFSARYGNIYTTLQLLQLIERAVCAFTPVDQFWSDGKGHWFDLLRPRIMPHGFSSRAEAEHDTRQHLAAVKSLLEGVDVFVFTLGLTEVWLSKLDGAAYPTCPGCGSAGDFDPSKYEFHNLSVAETSAALSRAIGLLKEINPSIQIVLTVSPVPLVATMADRHVLQATVYSKSVLRVAAEEAVRSHRNVHYFGSYEIITATRNTHAYFDDDLRTVTPEGVGRALEVFFARFCRGIENIQARAARLDSGKERVHRADTLVCDEEDFFRGVANLHDR